MNNTHALNMTSPHRVFYFRFESESRIELDDWSEFPNHRDLFRSSMSAFAKFTFIYFLFQISHCTEYCDRQRLENQGHCSLMTRNNQHQDWSLVLYEENSVLPIHKQERRFSYADHDFVIKQNWSKLGVAAVVWDAAEVLCEYLEQNPAILDGKTVLELGAGTGLVGMVAAVLGGKVRITDREAVMEFLQSTVKENLPEDIYRQTEVSVLDWTDINSHNINTHDVILGADIVYIKEVFDDLLNTLLKLSNENTVILLSCRIRYERDTNFLSKLSLLFQVEKILYDEKKDVNIYKAIKR